MVPKGLARSMSFSSGAGRYEFGDDMWIDFWAVAQVLGSKLRQRTMCSLLAAGMITSGLFAQISPAASELPPSQQVIAFLTDSIDWYRHCTFQQQTPSYPTDLIFVEDNRPRAAQILQLSFAFARADAQLAATPAPAGQKGIAPGWPDLAEFLQLQRNTELQSRQARERVEAIKLELRTAHGNLRRELQAQLDATQSRLDVLQAGLGTIGQSVDFLQAFTSRETDDLASTIDDLARTVPDVTTALAATQTLSLPLPPKPGDSGILALASEVTLLERKLRILDDEIQRTSKLRQSSDELRKRLIDSLNKRLPAVAVNSVEARNLSELRQQKTRLDELAALVKALSPAIVSLDKQRVLLAAYTAHLGTWRAAVVTEDKKTWMNLITRSLGAAAVIGALVILGAGIRRLTRRHMRETDRRHVILVIQRLILWASMVLVAAFALSSDLTSLATFFGLLAAGIAVALQYVIVAAIGYFVLVGRRGIRIGDRLELSGVTGDVTDIGWLQFQLREIDKGTRQPTGRIVNFSNSFVFLSPATALSKFNRGETISQSKVAAKGSQSLVANINQPSIT
jgi:Mechanosensitive ion channel, beta-domain